MSSIDRRLGSEDEGSESANSMIQSQSSVGSSLKSSLGSEDENQDGMFEEELDPEFKERFAATKDQFLQLRDLSNKILKKLSESFPQLAFEDSSSNSSVSDFQHRYQDTLQRLDERRAEFEETKLHYAKELELLKDNCTQAEKEKAEKEGQFRAIRKDAYTDAIIQRTNKPIRATDFDLKEGQLSAKEFELEQARVDFIRTKNKHKQTEDELNKQDQLSEGLHLIDFEQLKIENQTLNEKKAEKSQDLEKIRKKIEVNAHTLTHVKEKLAFVVKHKQQLQRQQEGMDNAYAQSRAKLATARIHRDKVRDENSNLKKSSGLIGMTDLLYDFENRSNELELMQDRVTELKTRFNDLTSMQHELEAKISQRQPLDPTLLRMNK